MLHLVTSAEKNKPFHHRPSHSEDIPSVYCTNNYILFLYKLLPSTIPKIINTCTRVSCFQTDQQRHTISQQNLPKKICTTVFKCLNDDVQNFEDYFELISHGKGTGNNNRILITPKIMLESAKKAFYYNGAVVYNSLPLEKRTEGTYHDILQKNRHLSKFLKQWVWENQHYHFNPLSKSAFFIFSDTLTWNLVRWF